MQMEESKIGFDLDGIAHLLADRLLAVPIYQRSYSWQQDEIEDFWMDLQSAFSQTDPEYFLGTIVLSREGAQGRTAIIDGQQRLATTAILLSAIRDEYRRRGDGTRADIIQRTYLASPDLESGEDVAQIWLNSEDHNYFKRVVIDGERLENVEPASLSHTWIASAITSLRDHVKKTADDVGTEWSRRLLDWTNFLKERVRIIVVDVPTESDAFLIFETLNDRGADLTIADLLKNYLFGRAGSRIDTVRDGWLTSLGALDMSAENAIFTTFLRHYWSSRHGATRERELYKSIKARVISESQAIDFIENLQRAARLYAALLNSDHEFGRSLAQARRAM
jgi:uncharacterized protein with ParB-like and HNH nuclease domain